ncbi:MAG: hypothetical protein PUG16_04100 [Lachnospiraceae bacterium]|nr:hypothetical protein [Lachnospiraceae bacterium]
MVLEHDIVLGQNMILERDRILVEAEMEATRSRLQLAQWHGGEEKEGLAYISAKYKIW